MASKQAAKNQFRLVEEELDRLRKRQALLQRQDAWCRLRGKLLPSWAAEELARVTDRIAQLANPEDGIRVHHYRPTATRVGSRNSMGGARRIMREATSGLNAGRKG